MNQNGLYVCNTRFGADQRALSADSEALKESRRVSGSFALLIHEARCLAVCEKYTWAESTFEKLRLYYRMWECAKMLNRRLRDAAAHNILGTKNGTVLDKPILTHAWRTYFLFLWAWDVYMAQCDYRLSKLARLCAGESDNDRPKAVLYIWRSSTSPTSLAADGYFQVESRTKTSLYIAEVWALSGRVCSEKINLWCSSGRLRTFGDFLNV